ncbi:phospholipase D-like domain-containing protein [Nitrosovibrio tenuis]|uniref:phospholipase D-like domain-containing protein n=1 Tax=Nitrosovibrio tenuis TaxID=1233 RepID=UPI000AD5CBEA|nr:phospholipase D-like domain-containing protein [Nitrosovibrio tenuis]
MAIAISNSTNGIQLKLMAYSNCDDVQLFWRVTVDGIADSPIPGCLGFMIERQRMQDNGEWAPVEILRNRVAFVDQPEPAAFDDPKDLSRPSNVWPFQRYEWTDHGANNGQTLRYRISAIILPTDGTAGTTVLTAVADTGWTQSFRIDAATGNELEAYFNRGFVMSQFVSRIARENGWKAPDIKEHLKELEEPLRRFLSGELRLSLLRLVDEVIDSPLLELYGALYELSDKELIDRLQKGGTRAHIVLANGSKGGDENAEARAALKKAKVDVHDRLLGNKGLGHNKFVVIVRKKDQLSLKAWTGSTNWTPSGLCTQVNNGLLIKNGAVAQIFLDQWHRLAAADGDFPPELVSKNAESPRSVDNLDVWFTRVRNKSKKNAGSPGIDIQGLIDLVKSAKSMVLYVMFQPGPEPLTTILQSTAQVYTRGVVSTVIGSNVEYFSLKGIDTQSRSYRTALIQPEGVARGFSSWIAEVTRAQFLPRDGYPGIGHAITHSKMIVIDPFSDDCKVITGSHNFSGSASEQNDDNFVVVHRNKALAEAYAVACLGTYEHYAWRAYVKDRKAAGKSVWSHLSTDPSWQQTYLTTQRKDHLSRWC